MECGKRGSPIINAANPLKNWSISSEVSKDSRGTENEKTSANELEVGQEVNKAVQPSRLEHVLPHRATKIGVDQLEVGQLIPLTSETSLVIVHELAVTDLNRKKGQITYLRRLESLSLLVMHLIIILNADFYECKNHRVHIYGLKRSLLIY